MRFNLSVLFLQIDNCNAVVTRNLEFCITRGLSITRQHRKVEPMFIRNEEQKQFIEWVEDMTFDYQEQIKYRFHNITVILIKEHSLKPKEELVGTLLQKYPSRFHYFCTLPFDFPINELPYSYKMVSKVIRKLKNLLHRELFGRGKFRLAFMPVIEQKTAKGRPVLIHAHILMSHPDKNSRLEKMDKDFPKIIEECWLQSDKRTSLCCKKVKKNFHDVTFILTTDHKTVQKTDGTIKPTVYCTKLITGDYYNPSWINYECIDLDNLFINKRAETELEGVFA